MVALQSHWSTDDPGEFSELVRPLAGEVRADALGRDFRIDVDAGLIGTSPIFRIHVEHGHIASDVHDSYAVTVPLCGPLTIAAGLRRVPVQPGEAHVVRPGDSFDVVTSKQTGPVLVVDLNRAVVVATAAGREGGGPLQPRHTVSLSTEAGSKFYREATALWTRQQLSEGSRRSVLADRETELLLAEEFVEAVHTGSSETRRAEGLDKRWLDRVSDYIDANLRNVHSLSELASLAGVRPESLVRAFTRRFGRSPMNFVRHRRLESVHRAHPRRRPGRHDGDERSAALRIHPHGPLLAAISIEFRGVTVRDAGPLKDRGPAGLDSSSGGECASADEPTVRASAGLQRQKGSRHASRPLLSHRPGRTRTCNPRFWRPVLCQIELRAFVSSAPCQGRRGRRLMMPMFPSVRYTGSSRVCLRTFPARADHEAEGGQRESNPQPPEPQSGALTD